MKDGHVTRGRTGELETGFEVTGEGKNRFEVVVVDWSIMKHIPKETVWEVMNHVLLSRYGQVACPCVVVMKI
jgi:hypothetical protein